MSQQHRPRRAHPAPLQPNRVRRIGPGFAFIPNRFLHEGFFASLDHIELSLYFFLVLAGDRNGVCFYSYDRICTTLEITLDDYVQARNALIDRDLIAFDGSCFQVLSLPPSPVPRRRRPLLSRDDLERDDPATVRLLARSSLDQR